MVLEVIARYPSRSTPQHPKRTSCPRSSILGYSPRHGEQITSVTSAIGKERGYMLRVSRFASLGFSFDDFGVHVHDLPEGIGIDGLLGLSFLRRFNYEVRSVEGRILIDRA